MDLSGLFNQTHLRNRLVLDEITDITHQLVKMYKTTDNLADQQYIFSKLKDIIKISGEQRLDKIYQVALRAMIEITTVSKPQ